MENVTKKRELAPALMARVDACAYIFMADKPDKIKAIAESREVPELEAGRIYTIGALKAAKRRGTAKNYREALETLEAEQAGDRGNPLTRSVSADDTASKVAHYKRMTDGIPMRINKLDVVRMSWARMDNRSYAAYVRPQDWQVEDGAAPAANKQSHARNMGKVLGTLYAEMEYRRMQDGTEHEYTNKTIEGNIRRFFEDYTKRLSRTVNERINDLCACIDAESGGDADTADKVISVLSSRGGRKAPGASKLAVFAMNLHNGFPHRDAVTCREFISLLYRYGRYGRSGKAG
jgi:hypothetical protein